MLYTVLGATGFVGSRLVKALLADGHEVYAPERDAPELFSRELGQVFYCIGLTADYAVRPYDTVEAHVALLARFLRDARFERLLYLSSTRLYDGQAYAVGEEGSSFSFNPHQSRHLYDLSKALGENLCLNFSAGRAAVARLSCVYDFAPQSPGFLSEWLQRLGREREFTLDSSSGVARDYIRLDDVILGLRAIMDQHVDGVFNLASGENVSNQELAEVLENYGWRIRFTRNSEKEIGVLCDISRLQSLGIRPGRVRDFMQTYAEQLSHHALD